MRRGIYDNSYNNGHERKRIDGRPQSSWATQAGLRGVHRDTRGNVIGGFTADGQGWGNKVRGVPPRQAAPAPIQTTVSQAPPAPVAPPLPKPAAPTPVATAAKPTSPMPAPVSKINGMPAKQAIAQARRGTEAAWQSKVTAPPVTYGADIATKNIATMGQKGAVADYFARSAKEAAAPLVAAANSKPAAGPSTWQDAAGLKKPVPKPTTPKISFNVAPTSNPQPIGSQPEAPPKPAPAAPSSFEQLTTPKVQPPAAPAAGVRRKTRPTSPQAPSRPMSSGASFTTADSRYQAREKQNAAQQTKQRSEYNKVWNSKSDLPVVDKNSWANKAQKSVRTFLGGNSY